MFLIFVFLAQLVVCAIVVFILKKILDNILIDSAIRQLELCNQGKKSSIDALTVISYQNLNTKNQERITRAALKQFGETAKPAFTIDRSLLGGMVIKVGSRIIDCSLKDRLRQARV